MFPLPLCRVSTLLYVLHKSSVSHHSTILSTNCFLPWELLHLIYISSAVYIHIFIFHFILHKVHQLCGQIHSSIHFFNNCTSGGLHLGRSITGLAKYLVMTRINYPKIHVFGLSEENRLPQEIPHRITPIRFKPPNFFSWGNSINLCYFFSCSLPWGFVVCLLYIPSVCFCAESVKCPMGFVIFLAQISIGSLFLNTLLIQLKTNFYPFIRNAGLHFNTLLATILKTKKLF